MPEVAVTINGRDYNVKCADGEEERLTRLAAYVDEQFAELFDSVGDVGDTRLMVMTSLMMADKVFDASAEIDRLRAQIAQAQQTAASGSGDALAPLVDEIAQRIEDIAARLEST